MLARIRFYGTKLNSYQDTLKGWLRNTNYAKQATSLANLINKRQWKDRLFDNENAWIHAKIALENLQISLDDYSSVMLRRAIATDLNVRPTTVPAMSIDDKQLIQYLSAARTTQSYGEPIQGLIDYVKKHLPEDQQYCFVAKTTTLNSMFQRIMDVVGAHFEPVRIDDGSYLFIIPSFALLKCWHRYYVETHNAKVPSDEHYPFVEIVPCEGELTAKDILDFHLNRKHPMGISTPFCEQTFADGHPCGHYAFSWHDAVFHWTRLTRRVNLDFDVYVISKAVAYYESLTGQSLDESLPSYLEASYKGLHMLLTILVDMEHSLSNRKGDITRPLSDIIRGPLGTSEKSNLMKHFNAELMNGLLSFVLACMIADRNYLKDRCAIDVEDMLKKIILFYSNHTARYYFPDENQRYIKEGYLDVIHCLKDVLLGNTLSMSDKDWLRSITSIHSFVRFHPFSEKEMNYDELDKLDGRLRWIELANKNSSAFFQPDTSSNEVKAEIFPSYKPRYNLEE